MRTGTVISIYLHNPVGFAASPSRYGHWNLSGEIRPSLLELKSLQCLDPSLDTFGQVPIPQFLGSLRTLWYLNLSKAGFSGPLPANLGNLSTLQTLDISSDFFGLTATTLDWKTGLLSQKHLVMNGVDLSLAKSNWIAVFNMLPTLTDLHLSECSLSGPISDLGLVNFTSLVVLDLSFNMFKSLFSNWLLNISGLTYIDLSSCSLYGRIPVCISELPNLRYLDLQRNNNLSASCYKLFQGSWQRIEVIILFMNKLHGRLPSSIGNVSFLTNFDLFANNIEVGIPSSVSKRCNLQNLDLSSNNPTDSLPEVLEQSNYIGNTPFPSFMCLRLSMNHMVGNLSLWLGQIENLIEISLDGNFIEGPIPTALGDGVASLRILRVRSNSISGEIPVSFFNLSSLKILDLAENNLTGSNPVTIGDLKAMSRKLNGSLFYGMYQGLSDEENLVLLNGPQNYI